MGAILKVRDDKGNVIEIPALKGDPGKGDMETSVYDTEGKKTDVFKYVDQKIDEIPEVDAYTKTQTLADATKAMFGMGTNAVPDDVFAYFGRYAQHCWRKRKLTPTVVSTPLTGNVNIITQIEYSYEVEKVGSTVVLVNPKQMDITYNYSASTSNGNELAAKAADAPCYFKNGNSSTVYKLPQGATYSVGYNQSPYGTICFDRNGAATGSTNVILQKYGRPLAETVTDYYVAYGEWELLFSGNRSAYPDSGVSGEYEYEYLGVPFENLAAPTSSINIVTGSYVGTGTSGSGNPNSLTFDFEPKIVMLTSMVSTGGDRYTLFGNAGARQGVFAMYPALLTSDFAAGYGFVVEDSYDQDTWAKKVGTTISWYHKNSASKQGNLSGWTYHYMALG